MTNIMKKVTFKTLALLITIQFLIAFFVQVIPTTVDAAIVNLEIGTGDMYTLPRVLTKISSINMGTLDLSKRQFTSSFTFHILNKGNSDAKIEMHVLSVYGPDMYGGGCAFDDNQGLNYNHIISKDSFTTERITFNGRSLKAGTYTVNYSIKPLSGTAITINGGAIQPNADGVFLIPIKVKLIGKNPLLPEKIEGLKAKSGNNQVELRWPKLANWGELDEIYGVYNVYRRDGEETNLSQNFDLSKYEVVYEDEIETDHDVYLVDYSAENGKTYSYFVLAGNVEHGYPSEAVTVTPTNKVKAKPAAPYFSSTPYGFGPGFIDMEWQVSYEDKSTGEGYIDHFNIYRNGALVAQVDQNNYIEDHGYTWDWDTHSDIEYYKYHWKVSLPVETGILYDWWITAVNTEGTEGYESEHHTAIAPDDKPSITSMQLTYNPWNQTEEDWESGEDRYTPAVSICINNQVYYGIKAIKVWRNGTYLGQFKGSGTEDINIEKNKTYRYDVSVIDNKGNESEKKTLQIKTNSEQISSVYMPWIDYNIKYGNTVQISFNTEENETYKIYRNNQLIGTYTSEDERVTCSNKVTEDGTYTYYVKITRDGFTYKTDHFVFVKDTSPQELAEKPAAPKLTTRVTNESVLLKWNEPSGGGEVDGYYIYKEIPGENGRELDVSRFPDSDGYWSTWAGSESPLGRYIRLYADKKQYIDEYLPWYSEDDMPIKYYICAYNQYGVSEPSNIVTFNYNNGEVAGNNDTVAPGKPVISKVWTESTYEDEENAEKYQDLFVTWDAPLTGGGVDSYEVKYEKVGSDYSDTETVYYGREQISRKYLDLEYDYDYNDFGTYRVTVTAINRVNGVEKRKTSDPVEIEIAPTPKLSLSATSETSVKLSWTAPDDQVNASNYEVYRQSKYGLCEKLNIPNGAIVKSNGKWTYTDSNLQSDLEYSYYVVAILGNNKGRVSTVKKITPSKKSLLAQGPTNLKMYALYGNRYLLTWTANTTAGTPTEYLIQYKYNGDDEWYTSDNIPASRTAYEGNFYQGDEVRVVAYNNAGEGGYSNVVTVPANDKDPATYYPYHIYPTITTGDAQITLSWKKQNVSGWENPYYYEILKQTGPDEYPFTVQIIRFVSSKTNYSWTDTDVENGHTYEYWVHATNNYGYDYVNDYSVWGTPEGSKPSSEQITAGYVTNTINALPEVVDVDLSDEDDVSQIERAIEIYEGLSEDEKNLIPQDVKDKFETLKNMLSYAEAEDKYSTVATSAQTKISNLPEVETINENSLNNATLLTKIANARDAYDNLPDDAKQLVDISKLIAIENKIKELRQAVADRDKINEVLALINSLPNARDININNATAVGYNTDSARYSYDSLTPRQKEILQSTEEGANALSKLEAIELKLDTIYESVIEQQRIDREEAQSVTDIINALGDPSDVTIYDEDDIENARNAYNALTDSQKALVSNETLAILTGAEEELQVCIEADAVAQLISNLSVADTTPENAETIQNAIDAYNNLSDDAKAKISPAQVTKLETIEDLYNKIGTDEYEQAYNQAIEQEEDINIAQSVTDIITRLPGASRVTLDDEQSVLDAVEAYNNLTDSQKALVDKTKLDELVEAIRELKENATKSIKTATVSGIANKTYSGKGRTQSLTVKIDGVTLVKGTDYTLSYKNNVNVGTATVTITGMGHYEDSISKTYKILAKKITPTVILSTTNYTYSGTAKKPIVAVKDGTKQLATSNYSVSYASGRKNVGRYAVKVTLKKNYSGYKTVYFNINPKGTTISKLTKASKAFTVKWKKQSAKMSTARVTGYQIQYSTSKTFASGNKTVTVKGYSKVSKKISKLKAKKTYYVRIRTYTKIGTRTYYSVWSAKKYVKTK